jgi:hypothetical protein
LPEPRERMTEESWFGSRHRRFGIQLNAFLNSAIDVADWSSSHIGRLTPPSTPKYVGPPSIPKYVGPSVPRKYVGLPVPRKYVGPPVPLNMWDPQYPAKTWDPQYPVNTWLSRPHNCVTRVAEQFFCPCRETNSSPSVSEPVDWSPYWLPVFIYLFIYLFISSFSLGRAFSCTNSIAR